MGNNVNLVCISDVCFTQGLSARGGLAQTPNGFVRGCRTDCSNPQIHVISLQNPYMYRLFERVRFFFTIT